MREIRAGKIEFAKTVLADTQKAILDLDDYLNKKIIDKIMYDEEKKKLQATEQGLIKDIARVEK